MTIRLFPRVRAAACACAAALLCVPLILAQAQPSPAASASPLNAVIIAPSDSPVGRRIVLDASASHLAGSNIQYAWYVNDNPEPISKTVDAIFTPDRDGSLTFRLVVTSSVSGRAQEETAVHTVVVFKRKVTLVADASVAPGVLADLQREASAHGTYVRLLQTAVPASSRTGDDALSTLATEQSAAFLDADSVVLWTDAFPIPGLQALMKAVGADSRVQATMRRQTLLVLTDRDLSMVARAVQGPLSVLPVKRFLLGHSSLLGSFLGAPGDDAFVQAAHVPPSDLLDASTVRIPSWSVLSLLTNYMVRSGVSGKTIFLLLMLPVIAMILAFLKQVVGITTFGLFAPAIISLSFLVLGWWVGVLFLVFILLAGYLSRALMGSWHILYIPKMAIILGIVSITLLLLVGMGTAVGISLSHDTVFVLLIMSTLVESFLNVKSEQGLLSAVLAIGQTVVAALLCVLIVRWPAFETLVIAYPEVILLTVFINVLLGRYTGLRVTEYVRFREVFKHLREE